jgi:hypothetical protein
MAVMVVVVTTHLDSLRSSISLLHRDMDVRNARF